MTSESVRRYPSIVDEKMMAHFGEIRGRTLMSHAFNSFLPEDVLALSSVLWPEIIEVEGCIFVSEFYNGNFESLKEQFDGDKTAIEKWVNSWSLSDFFLEKGSSESHQDEVIESFGEVLTHFWALRLAQLFPGRNFVVQLGDGLMGERGLAITVYED